MIGDKLDVSKNRYKSLLEDALTSCGTKITYNVYQSKPHGYSSTYGEHYDSLPSGVIRSSSNLDQIAKEFLKEVFVNNRLVIIGDENGHFIYGLTKQGFLTPSQLLSHHTNGIEDENLIFSSVFYSGPSGESKLDSLTYYLNSVWSVLWGQVKSLDWNVGSLRLPTMVILYDYWYSNFHFKPYF